MTLKDYIHIQWFLGYIEGAILMIDNKEVRDCVGRAVEAIGSTIRDSVRKEIGDDG